MTLYKIVKRNENPTIPLNKVSCMNGFIVVSSDDEPVGVIVYDSGESEYIMINNFHDTFAQGICPTKYTSSNLEDLMERIKDNYMDPVEFNFIRVEQ